MPVGTLGRDWGAVRLARQAQATLEARAEAVLLDMRDELFPAGDVDLPLPRTWWRHDSIPVEWGADGLPAVGLFVASSEWRSVDGMQEYQLDHELVVRLVVDEEALHVPTLTDHHEALSAMVHALAWTLQRWLPEDGAGIGVLDAWPVRTVASDVPLDTDNGRWLKVVDTAVRVVQRTLMT